MDNWINAFSGNKTNVWDPQNMGLDKQWQGGTDASSPETGSYAPGVQSGWSTPLDGGQTQQYGMGGEDLGVSQDKSTWESLKPLGYMAALATGMGGLSGLGAGADAGMAGWMDGASAWGAPAGASSSGGTMGSLADLFGSSSMGKAGLVLPDFLGGGSLGLGGKLTLGQGLSSLYDMWSKKKTAGAQQDAYNKLQGQVENMYAPGSPEAKLMEQEMARKDAAAGRNSQYGVRATDLAGKIAESKLRALTSIATPQNALLNQSLSNQYGGLNSLFGYLGKNNALASLPGFASQSSPSQSLLSNLFTGN